MADVREVLARALRHIAEHGVSQHSAPALVSMADELDADKQPGQAEPSAAAESQEG